MLGASDTRRGLTLAIEASNPSATPGVDGFAALGRCARTSPITWDVRSLGAQAFARPARRRGGPAGAAPGSLIKAIDALVERAAIDRRDIARVAVSVGPGGFTSVRMSVATAAALAVALDAECVAVPTAEIVARGVEWSGPGSSKRAVIALAGKRDSAWAAVCEPPVRVGEPPYAIWRRDPVGAIWRAAEFEAAHARAPIDLIVADAHLPESIRAWARDAGVRVEPPALSAVACFEASLARKGVDPAALAPIYPREPEAVSKWRARERAS